MPIWKALLTAGGLVLAVMGTLILGATLHSEPTDNGLPPRRDLPSRPLTDLPTPETAPTAAPSISEAPEAVQDRASKARRLRSSGYEWTLQFMVTCREDSAQTLLASLDYDARLHLIPYRHDDRPCYRVCWGSFATRDEALSLGQPPQPLLDVNREPIPRRVQDLFP